MICTNELINNIEIMSYDELKQLCVIVTELYLKYDSDEFNTTAEHFRCQIDMIENHSMKTYGKTTFDE